MPTFLFTGENKFLINQTIHKRKEAFIKKYGPENFFYYTADKVKTDEIINTIFNSGLFIQKKFIVIFGYPKDTDSENKISEGEYKKLDKFVLENISKFPEENVVVFVSYSPDKRTKSFKLLKEKVEIKTFSNLKENDLIKFVQKNLPGISQENAKYLIEKCGNNMFKIQNEINKIKFYIIGKKNIDRKKTIESVVFSQESIDQFKLLDRIILYPEEGYKLLSRYSKTLEPFSFLGLFYRAIKNTLLITDLYKKGYKGSKQIAEKLKLHPFVVMQRLKIIDKILPQEERLKNIFKNLINIEYKIKTGKMPMETFWIEIKKSLNTIN